VGHAVTSDRCLQPPGSLRQCSNVSKHVSAVRARSFFFTFRPNLALTTVVKLCAVLGMLPTEYEWKKCCASRSGAAAALRRYYSTWVDVVSMLVAAFLTVVLLRRIAVAWAACCTPDSEPLHAQ